MNPNDETNAPDIRSRAVVEMIQRIKESLRPIPPGQEAQHAERMLATLKLAIQGLQDGPMDKATQRAIRSVQKTIREYEKWKAECERTVA